MKTFNIFKEDLKKSLSPLKDFGKSFADQAEKFAKNSYFYLLERPTSSLFNWYIIMTLNGSFKIIMNKITFFYSDYFVYFNTFIYFKELSTFSY